MKILAIETSCDETAIALVEVKKDSKSTKFKILGNEISSQIDIHKEYGGVFPAIAKREHIKNLPLVLKKVLREAKIKEKDIDKKISTIAVTTGPGLEPALWTGIVLAKELSSKYKLPIVPVNHMEGHIFSIFPKKGKTFSIKNDKELFPILTLLVSGGHTELVFIKNWMKYKKIGQTRDDAVGEAFDKVARMIGLPYPGGPEIGKLASIERENVVPRILAHADISQITLPRPMMYSKDYDFSFSGLKTAVLYMIRDIGELTDVIKRKIAKEFEDAAFEVLSYKTMKAIKEYKIKTLIVGGGVSASLQLKKVMTQKIKELQQSKVLPYSVKVHFPGRGYTGDNALMIAIAGYYQYKNKKYTTKLGSIKANGNLSL